MNLPEELFRLEEINLPTELAQYLSGRTARVEALPEELPATRRVEPDDFPLLIDPQGNYWNDYRPVRVFYTDIEGRVWRLPRRWLAESKANSEPRIDCSYSVSQEIVFVETLNLPTEWDLWEINIPWEEAHRAGGCPSQVEVRIGPGEEVKVFWRDSIGAIWRIAHDWRRRRIKLPSTDVLISQEIPRDVAEEYSEKIVSVNYHPGLLCCLPDRYRFRDAEGNRWPVRIRDCVALGYGDGPEHRA